MNTDKRTQVGSFLHISNQNEKTHPHGSPCKIKYTRATNLRCVVHACRKTGQDNMDSTAPANAGQNCWNVIGVTSFFARWYEFVGSNRLCSQSDLADQHKHIARFGDRERCAILPLSRPKTRVLTALRLRAQIFAVMLEPILKQVIRLGILRTSCVTRAMRTRCVPEYLDKFPTFRHVNEPSRTTIGDSNYLFFRQCP